MVRLQLDFKNLRGQTYDGASNMLGKKSGVAAQLKSIQPKAKETHCHSHSLNSSVKDVTQESKTLKDTMGTVGEICILLKYSPKRENLLGEIQSNNEGITAGEEFVKRKVTTLDKLCPTRWTVRANCYQEIIYNYESLVELWQTSLKNGKLVFDAKSRITGCLAQSSLDFTMASILHTSSIL